MAKSQIVTGLDIGTNSIKALVAEKRGQDWNVLSYLSLPSFGLRKGAVVNVEEVSRNIQILIPRLEKNCGQRIGSAFVNIGGSHLHVESSDGLISVSRADHIISEEDIDRVLQATRAINIPSNEEILDVFAKEFIVDDRRGIKQPLGLTGVRLEAKVILLCYFQSYFVNLTHAVLNSKIQIDDIVPSPLAAARAVITPQQKEIGVALIDIGSATTSLAVFEEGDLIHLAVFPLGSSNITNDIAIGLKTEVAVAEDIKKQYGSCVFEKSGKEKRTIDKPYPVSFNKKNLVGIVAPRVSEILNLMQKELKSIGRHELLPGGIVLTGGGVKLPKIKDLVKEQLKLPCQIGVPKGIVGMEEDPSLATVAGLVLGGADFSDIDKKGMPGLDFFKGLNYKFKKMFRVFIP